MMSAGFPADRLVLSIPTVEIMGCFDEEAGPPSRSDHPLRSILSALIAWPLWFARISHRQGDRDVGSLATQPRPSPACHPTTGKL
jgi:hypothetical protein